MLHPVMKYFFPFVWLLYLAFLLPFCAYIEERNKTILTILPHAEAKGSIYMLASLGLRLRQHCQFLMLSLFVENNFSEGINKNNRDVISTKP
jgi:hypothetical protein